MKTVILALLLSAMVSINAAVAQPLNQSPEKAAAPAASQSSQQQPSDQARKPSKRERSITGCMLDESSQPIQDAIILVLPAGLINTPQTPQLAAKIRPVSTDEQGKFAVENLSPGAYKLMPFVPGYVAAPDTSEDLDRKYYLTGDSVTLRMLKGGVITGTVTNSDGEPVVGVRVHTIPVRDLKGRTLLSDAMSTQQEWKTDDRGVYRIYGLNPGVYVVSAGGRGL